MNREKARELLGTPSPKYSGVRSIDTLVEGPARIRRTLRILIVDDEAAVGRGNEKAVRVIDAGLQAKGIMLKLETTLVIGGPEAIDKIRNSEAFDLIISDYNMPHASGLDVLHAAKDKCIGTKVVFFSAEISDLEKSQVMHDGAEAVFKKPVPIETIYKMLMDLFDDSREQAESG